jgi:hypothetical protein
MPSSFLSGSCRAGLALASVLAGALVPLSACSDGGSTVLDTFAVTSVAVTPEAFLTGVTCGEGGMRRYVATLSDVSAGDNSGGGFVLPSSAPVPCFLEVRFERVTIGREYATDIQGYDRDDIVPLGCFPVATAGCAGSTVMVDAATGVYVAPRWTTSCGHHRSQPGVDAGPPPDSYDAGARSYGECRGRAPAGGGKPWLDGPVCVLDLVTIPVRGCDPLRDASAAP